MSEKPEPAGERPAYVLNPKFVEAFWERARRIDHEQACWPWQGSLHTTGYPVFLLDEQQYAGHRVAYELEVGPLPPNHFVGHHCNCRSCVRPDHLYLKEGPVDGKKVYGWTQNHNLSKDIRSTIFALEGTEVAPGLRVFMGSGEQTVAAIERKLVPHITRLGKGLDATDKSLARLREAVGGLVSAVDALGATVRELTEAQEQAAGKLDGVSADASRAAEAAEKLAADALQRFEALGEDLARARETRKADHVSRETSGPFVDVAQRQRAVEALCGALAQAVGCHASTIDHASMGEVYDLAIDRAGPVAYVDLLEQWLRRYLKTNPSHGSSADLLRWVLSADPHAPEAAAG